MCVSCYGETSGVRESQLLVSHDERPQTRRCPCSILVHHSLRGFICCMGSGRSTRSDLCPSLRTLGEIKEPDDCHTGVARFNRAASCRDACRSLRRQKNLFSAASCVSYSGGRHRSLKQLCATTLARRVHWHSRDILRDWSELYFPVVYKGP